MTLKDNILSYLFTIGVSLGVIVVIILSVLSSKACAGVINLMGIWRWQ